jgi:hypothetical protein
MSTTKSRDLESQIEALVREHIAMIRHAATTAVERAFAGGSGARSKAKAAARRRTVKSLRRGPEEMAALSERLYVAICAQPGAGMPALASQLGVSSGELNVPATRLRRAGRVRSVGQRQGTRYFPMTGRAAK